MARPTRRQQHARGFLRRPNGRMLRYNPKEVNEINESDVQEEETKRRM